MVNTLATFNQFLVFTAILSTFSGFPMYSCDDHRKNIEYKIYCSSNLSETLELICGGKFYSFSRKYPGTIAGSSPRAYQESPLLRKLVSEQYHQPQSSTGSTHECCKRPCGYAELRLYCANI